MADRDIKELEETVWTIVNKVDRKKSKKCFKLNGR